MHSGGSMTGGSSASRMTSLLSREREIKEHEKLLVSWRRRSPITAAASSGGEAIRQEIKQRRAQAFEAIRQAQIDVSDRAGACSHADRSARSTALSRIDARCCGRRSRRISRRSTANWRARATRRRANRRPTRK